MIHKIIGYGSKGSKGVMDYMLKEEDKKTPRAGATILRGDIETQAKLIDSLVGQFKQQYLTGVFSFEEHPDQVSDEQKQELMDGAEETIRAGLETDRVSIIWIEHTDKGRLELNYIVACVDLKHGRAFQPYLHHQDQERFNAFKDIQNIKHGYTDPNDPVKAQNLAQSNNLPKDVAELKEVITEHIEGLVSEGLVNSRDDVKQVLNDLGFELSRETNNSISVKRPDGGRNLKFTTAKNGGLYDINFRPDQTSEAEITRASERYRASATDRLAAAQEVYARELERKREYHQKRHSRPKREQRAVTRAINPTFSRYTPYSGRYALTVPNPFTHTLRKRSERNKRDDRELYKPYSKTNREQREQDKSGHKIGHGKMGYHRSDNFIHGIRSRDFTRVKNDQQTHHLQVLSRQQNRSDLHAAPKGLKHEQTVIRQDRASIDSTTGHDTATAINARREGREYSSLAELARTANNNADRALGTLANITRELEEHDQRAEKSVQWVDNSTQRATRVNGQLNERVDSTLQRSNSAYRASERVSEYDSTRKQSIERYRAVRERIRRLSKFTAENDKQAEDLGRTATATAKVAATIEIAREKEQKQQQEASRSYSPRRRMR